MEVCKPRERGREEEGSVTATRGVYMLLKPIRESGSSYEREETRMDGRWYKTYFVEENAD